MTPSSNGCSRPGFRCRRVPLVATRGVMERIEQAVEDLDVTIKHIRSAISGCQRPPTAVTAFTTRCDRCCRNQPRCWGSGHGSCSTVPSTRWCRSDRGGPAGDHRGGVTNSPAHAAPPRSTYRSPSRTSDAVDVADDGVGPPAPGTPSDRGFGDMAVVPSVTAARCSSTPPDRGTILTWRAPTALGRFRSPEGRRGRRAPVAVIAAPPSRRRVPIKRPPGHRALVVTNTASSTSATNWSSVCTGCAAAEHPGSGVDAVVAEQGGNKRRPAHVGQPRRSCRRARPASR